MTRANFTKSTKRQAYKRSVIAADLRQMAENIATTLHADLKAGEIAVINIDIIRDRCRRILGDGRARPEDFEDLERFVTRRVVEKC